MNRSKPNQRAARFKGSPRHAPAVRALWSGALAALVLSGTGGRVEALEAHDLLVFSRDPISIRPQLTVAHTYNDNIFSRSVQPEADLITTLSPGVNFRVGQEARNHLLLSYTFNQHLYLDRTDLNAQEHLISLRTRLQTDKLIFTGNDRIQFLSSPLAGGAVLEDDQEIERPILVQERTIDRSTFFDVHNLTYILSPRTGVYVQGLHSTVDYESGVNLSDYRTLLGTVGFLLNPLAKTSFFGEAFLGGNETDPNLPGLASAESIFYGGTIGARGQFTPKLSGLVRAGYQLREFSGSEESAGSPIVNLNANYQFSPKTGVALSYSRRQDVSVQFVRQSFTADVLSAQLSQQLGASRKWTAGVGGSFGMYEYGATAFAPQRGYDVYSGYFNLAYRIQVWLTANLGYNFTLVRYQAGLGDYDVNRVSLRLTAGY
jgi:hypothetical protein